MKISLLFKVAATLWICTLTVLLTRFWYFEPDSFPAILRSLGNWVIDTIAVKGSDQVGETEFLFVVLSAFSIAFISTCLLFSIIKILKKQV